MKIGIEVNSLVEALWTEMNEALYAMEAGDYNTAQAFLEARCRPTDAATDPLRGIPTVPARIAAQTMVCLLPHGLLREIHAGPFTHLACMLGRLTNADPAKLKPEDCFLAAQVAGDFGISLAWNFDAQ